jgi:SRSO17 transposase
VTSYKGKKETHRNAQERLKKMKPSQDITPSDALTSTKDLVQWVQALTSLHARIAPRFARPEPRRRALAYLQGVMSEIRRKNGWQLAEHARETTPYGMQRLLSSAVWDDGLVREDLRDYVYEHLGSSDAILVIDETSFPKQGDKSAGVKVQYCGTTGQIENCQVAVFLDYVTALGHTLIDCELYLPQDWIDDRERCHEAGIPDTVGFQTKCELARLMVERVYQAQIPISWVVADTVYGNNLDLRTWLEDHRYFHVLAVACNEPVGIQTPNGRKYVEVREVEALLLQAQDWQRLSMGDGTKGPRLYDWACTPVLHRWEDDGKHWLLIRRCIDNPKIKTYYFVFGPVFTTLQVMVKALGYRWRIEDDFETSKDLGLGQYQVRCFTAWYRHITLVMLAHAFLAVICAEARNASIGDAAPSPIRVVDAFPPGSVPHLPPLTLVPKEAPSLPVSQAPALPVPKKSSILPLLSAVSLSHGPATEAAVALSTPLVINPAPLTVPEVRHLLATLIWPTATNAQLMLAWSWWRRCHRGVASYYHTKRRLDAG